MFADHYEKFKPFDAEKKEGFSVDDLRIPGDYVKIEEAGDTFSIGVTRAGTCVVARCDDCYLFRDSKWDNFIW